MRLLDRYLLRELLVPLGFCLSGFLIFWMAFDLFGELSNFQEHKLNIGDIGLYYCVKAPEFLVIVLPIALLLALLYSLTNLARHHEITAIRGAGVSLWRLCLPHLMVGLGLSVALFLVNELWAPSSSERAQRIVNRRVAPQDNPQGIVQAAGLANLREGRCWLAGEYNPKTSQMRNPLVIWTLPDGSQLWLQAASAHRVQGVWTFFDARESRATAETNSLLTPFLHTNILAMPQFKETPEEIQSEINISKGMAFRAKNRADVPIVQILDYLRLHPHPAETIQPWLYTKLQGRLAAPWTCLVVVLIAIPFGAAHGRRNVFVGVASSIFICFFFFVLQQLGLALGTGGYLPPWLAAWFPNLTFGLAGLLMTARVR
jgi:lipopolysaccharide export system permease protein